MYKRNFIQTNIEYLSQIVIINNLFKTESYLNIEKQCRTTIIFKIYYFLITCYYISSSTSPTLSTTIRSTITQLFNIIVLLIEQFSPSLIYLHDFTCYVRANNA